MKRTLWIVVIVLALLAAIPPLCMLGMMAMGGMMMEGQMGGMMGGQMGGMMGGWGVLWMLLVAALLILLVVLLVRGMRTGG